jgi:hypothetical protein
MVLDILIGKPAETIPPIASQKGKIAQNQSLYQKKKDTLIFLELQASAYIYILIQFHGTKWGQN